MKTNYALSDDKAERELAFSAIKRIDDFFVKNISGFESVLRDNGIQSEPAYHAYLMSDPALEMSEKHRVLSSVNTLKKLKEFAKDYTIPRDGFVAKDFMGIQEALAEQAFVQDTGLSMHLDLHNNHTGVISIKVNGSGEKSLKLPFVIKWKPESMEDYEGNEILANIGAIELLDQGERFPSLHLALSEFKFTEAPNVGLMSETGYSINDLHDKAILMKVNAIDFSDTLEVLGFASKYQSPNPSNDMAYRAS